MKLMRFLVLWALAGGAEFPLMWNWMGGGGYPAMVAWGGHAMAAVLAALSMTCWEAPFRFSQRWAGWLFLWVSLLPGLGLAFGGILVVGGWNVLDPGAVTEEEDELSSALTIDLSKPSEGSPARIAREMDFVPLVEILAGDDINMKRGAVEQLTRLRTPEAIRVLMDHRSDPSAEMRFFVNSSLTRIKKEFDETLDAARYQMRLDVNNVADRLNLARVYLQYAQSGLLDTDLVNAYENEAIFHLTFVLNSNAPTPEAAEQLITHLIRTRDWTMAEASVQKARDHHLIDDVTMAEYQAVILYSRGQYGKVADVLRPFFGAPSLSADWKTTMLWWGVGT